MIVKRKTSLLLFVLDACLVGIVFHVMGNLRGVDVFSLYPTSVLLLPLSFIVMALYLIDGYRPRTDMMSLDYASQHTIALLAAMLGTLLITYAVITNSFPLQTSRLVILLSFVTFIPVSLIYRRLIYHRNSLREKTRSIVFVGDIASCLVFRDEARRSPLAQPLVFCVPTKQSDPSPFDDGTPVITLEEALRQMASGSLEAEAIVLRESNRELPPEVSQQLIRYYFNGTPTYTLELFYQVYLRKIPLYRLNPTWLFQEGFEIAREPVFDRIKRISDIVLACIGMVVFAPFIIVGGIAIWLEDRGPVFFRQTRIGKNHVPFQICKLRTMRPVSGEANPYTQVGDSRITRVGRFLRNTRIDELPQVWNVLKGDMSLIGPRAEWDRLVADYERQIPCYYFRHLVKPGITGWAQVNYPYGANIEDTLRKLEYDLYYIRHFSFALDAAIVLKTIHVMTFGKGR